MRPAVAPSKPVKRSQIGPEFGQDARDAYDISGYGEHHYKGELELDQRSIWTPSVPRSPAPLVAPWPQASVVICPRLRQPEQFRARVLLACPVVRPSWKPSPAVSPHERAQAQATSTKVEEATYQARLRGLERAREERLAYHCRTTNPEETP